MISLEELKLEWKDVVERISGFTKGMVAGAKANGVVLGVSGGIDSAVTAYLMVRALGKDKVLALIMPDSSVTPEEDVKDAKKVVEELDISYELIEISDIVKAYSKASFFNWEDKLPIGNLRARIRMSLLYLAANSKNLLVAGTGDRSEILLGYFTKYGDGGVDFLPIGDLYKTQVRWLGEHLGVPESIVKKPSSPRLWKGQIAEDEIGLTYDRVDLILHAIFDLKMSFDRVSSIFGDEPVRRVLELHSKSAHKRAMPPIVRVRF